MDKVRKEGMCDGQLVLWRSIVVCLEVCVLGGPGRHQVGGVPGPWRLPGRGKLAQDLQQGSRLLGLGQVADYPGCPVLWGGCSWRCCRTSQSGCDGALQYVVEQRVSREIAAVLTLP